MSKQELARSRNWMKARIMGFNINTHIAPFTDFEKTRINQIRLLLNDMLEHWDDGNIELGFKNSPKRRCVICSIRRKLQNKVCRECEKAIIESDGDVLTDEQKKRVGL